MFERVGVCGAGSLSGATTRPSSELSESTRSSTMSCIAEFIWFDAPAVSHKYLSGSILDLLAREVVGSC